jgi:hypothetical protein
MRRKLLASALAVFLVGAAAASAAEVFHTAKPQEFDPRDTSLVQAAWLGGIGCPTNATIATFDSSGTLQEGTYTDPACPTGDDRDNGNEGVLLAKTGPTANFASALVILNQVPETITELGYDIRKPGPSVDPRGSHCGAGAPRFNIITEQGQTFFLGCNSPPAPVQQTGTGWLRLRWGAGAPLQAFSAATGALVNVSGLNVDRLLIVFDEGQDAAGGPDQFGAAILDNIDVNGVLVGQGAAEVSR